MHVLYYVIIALLVGGVIGALIIHFIPSAKKDVVNAFENIEGNKPKPANPGAAGSHHDLNPSAETGSSPAGSHHDLNPSAPKTKTTPTPR